MTSNEFEAEIQKIDPRFTVVANPNHAALSNILFEGTNYDLPVISTYNIKDEIDHSYRFEFPSGMTARFWTRTEVLARLEDFLVKVKSGKLDDMYA